MKGPTSLDPKSLRYAFGVTRLADGLYYLARVPYDALGNTGSVEYTLPCKELIEASYNFKKATVQQGVFKENV